MSDQEAPSQTGKTPQAVVTHWLKELTAAEKHEEEWRRRADKITERYRDERKNEAGKRYNILFANTEVLAGVMYQKTPTPDVRRRFKDNDPLGRVTAEILTRALSYCIDAYDFDGVMTASVKDSLLPGRAVARVKYKPTIQKIPQPDPADPTKQIEVEKVVYEEAPSSYIEWAMFRMSPAKRWEKVRWVAFGEDMTRDDLVQNFGEEIGRKVNLTKCPDEHKDKGEGEDNIYRRAEVWVIWNKTDRKVYAVCDGYKEAPLAVSDDPLHLEGFFPMPRPIYSVWTNDSLIPVPEYTQYQDQVLELDTITERRTALIEMLRYRGIRDGSIDELAQLAKAKDGTFVAVQNYATLVEKGGLSKTFEAISNEDIAAVVEMLFEKQQDLKQAIYEITGISDIARGSTDPNETKGAQQLKAQYTNIRIGPRQKEVERFARDLLRLKAEIIAEHFSAETLQLMTGIQLPTPEQKALAVQEAQQQLQQAQMAAQQPPQPGQPPQQAQAPNPAALQQAQAMVTWDDVMKLLRDEKLRSFRIDVETDSTIRADDQADKQAVSEMIQALASLIEQMIPAVQSGALTKDFARSVIQFVMRRFKASKEIEEQIDKLFDDMPPPQPNPDAIKAQTEQKKAEMDMQAKQMDSQAKQQQMQLEQAKLPLEMEKLQVERESMEVEKQRNIVELLKLTQEQKTMEGPAGQVATAKGGNEQVLAVVQALIEQMSKPKTATFSDGRQVTVQ